MKLEMKITEKDKKLLLFLSIFVIVICFGYWGIYPLWTNIRQVNAQIQEDRETLADNQWKAVQVEGLREERTRMLAEIESMKENYYDMMTSDQVDRYMTTMALEHNLQAKDLDIVMPEESSRLEPYQYSAKGRSDSTNTGSTTADTGIYAVTVTMKLTGARADLEKLMDDLAGIDQKLLVKNYSYSTSEGLLVNADGSYDMTETWVLDTTLELYMCEHEEVSG
jgi:cell division protein FtsB